MALLKATYAAVDEIPQGYADLYSENKGQWELTGVEGMKTQADIDRLQKSLSSERQVSKDLRAKLEGLDGVPEDWREQIDRIPELEAQIAAGGGKPDQAAIDKLVEQRVIRETSPLKRELEKAQKQLGESTQLIESYKTKDRQRAIQDAVTPVLREAKVIDSAIEDAMFLAERHLEVEETEDGFQIRTKDGVGVTPGVEPKVWLEEIQSRKAHWFPESIGGGGSGGKGRQQSFTQNPWRKDQWNLTEQMKLEASNPNLAGQMAKAAGVELGAAQPAS